MTIGNEKQHYRVGTIPERNVIATQSSPDVRITGANSHIYKGHCHRGGCAYRWPSWSRKRWVEAIPLTEPPLRQAFPFFSSLFLPSFPSSPSLLACLFFLSLLIWGYSGRGLRQVDNYLPATGDVLSYSENLNGMLKGELVFFFLFFTWEKGLPESSWIEREI